MESHNSEGVNDNIRFLFRLNACLPSHTPTHHGMWLTLCAVWFGPEKYAWKLLVSDEIFKRQLAGTASLNHFYCCYVLFCSCFAVNTKHAQVLSNLSENQSAFMSYHYHPRVCFLLMLCRRKKLRISHNFNQPIIMNNLDVRTRGQKVSIV